MGEKKLWLRWTRIGLFSFCLFILTTQVTWAKPVAMHIMEGYLPLSWCLFWFVLALPFWLFGFWRVQKITQKPEKRLLLGLCGAFVFVLSALKMPSVTGSSSHPTGTGLGAILFGPATMSVLGTIVLLFQALLIAHGGLTTLGANAFSMAIVGPCLAFALWHTLKDRLPQQIVVFLAAALADLATYVVTATQLALAYPDPVGGFWAAWLKFATIFALTQIPLAISEGILTVLIFNALQSDAAVDLQLLGVSS